MNNRQLNNIPTISASRNKRDGSIDVLRWIALTGIILVHSKPDLFWTQLRNFDVPLMVLLSAVCFGSVGGGFSYYNYLQKRFIRLVLPSWIFLTFYFVGTYILTHHVSIHKVVMCYTLTTSWYLWIIRILVGMAIIAPFLRMLSERLKLRNLLAICAMLFGATELLTMFSFGYFYKVAVMFIPYTAIYLLGMNIRKLFTHNIFIAGVLLLLLYIVISVILYQQTGQYVPTQMYKYPPRIYYLAYALGVSAVLWLSRQIICEILRNIRLYAFAQFVGSHTFWIYLWHIPFVDYMVKRYDSLTTFITVYFIAIFITYIQTMAVNKLCDSISRPIFRKNLQMILIG